MSLATRFKLTWLRTMVFLFAIVTSPLGASSEPPALEEAIESSLDGCQLDMHLDEYERDVEHALQNLEVATEELKDNFRRLAEEQMTLRRLKEELADLTRRAMEGERLTIQEAQRAAQLPGRISSLEGAIQRGLRRSDSLTAHLYDLSKALRNAMKRYTSSCKICPPSGDFLDGIKRRFRGMFRGVKCSMLSILFSVGAGMAANAQSSDDDITMCGVLDSSPTDCGPQDGRDAQCISAGGELAEALRQFSIGNCTRDFGETLQCTQCGSWGQGNLRNRFQRCKELDEKARKLEQLISDFC